MKHFPKLVTVFFIALVLLLGLSAAVSAKPLQRPLATIWTVGGACGTTIQACINAASDGDTVLIPAGTYSEFLTLTKTVNLNGAGAVTTIVKVPSGLPQRPLTIQASGSLTISGLTLTGGNPSPINFGGGVYVWGNSAAAMVTLQNVTVTGNKGDFGAGGLYVGLAHVMLSSVIITGNQTLSASGMGGSGLYLASSSVQIINSLIADNLDSSGTGQIIADSGILTVTYTTIANATLASGAGIYAIWGTSATLSNTIVASETTGLKVNTSGNILEDYNLFFGNTANKSGTIGGAHDVLGNPVFANPAASNYHLFSNSAARAAGAEAGVATDFEGDARPSNWFGKNGFDIGYDQFVAATLPLAVCLTETHGLTAAGGWQNSVNQPAFIWSPVAHTEDYKVIYSNNGQHVITTTTPAYTLLALQSSYATDVFVEPHYLADPAINGNPGACLFTVRYDNQSPTVPPSAAYTANFPDNVWTNLAVAPQVTATAQSVHDGWFDVFTESCTATAPFLHACESGAGLKEERTYLGADPNGAPNTLWGPAQTWPLGSVPDGVYYFRMLATDNLNQTSATQAIRTLRLDTTAPTAVLTYTGNNPSILETNLPLRWSGSDAGSGLAAYDVLVNGTVWLTRTTATAATYTGVCDTRYQFAVRAYDAAGNSSFSDPQSVLVKCDLTSPTAIISFPTAGQHLRGSQVLITGTAGDNVQVVDVSVSTDGGATWQTPTGLTSWAYTWTLPGEAGVTHVLLARATDEVSNTTTSLPVMVTVDTLSRIFLPVILNNYDPARDHYEPDNTWQQAQPIAADGTLQHHNFYPAGDVDWARLDVGPGIYSIATSGLAQGNTYPDTVMALYAGNGATLLSSNDDCSPTTRASCITWTTSTSSTLYIKVWPYDTNSVGPSSWYDLSVVKQ